MSSAPRRAMRRFGKWSIVCGLTCASVLVPRVARAGGQQPSTPVSAPGPTASDLRTFVVEKPPLDQPEVSRRPAETTDGLSTRSRPPSHDTLRTTLGLGYVQGVDWGAEATASGAVSGIQVQLDSLLTRGAQGVKFDHGSARLSHTDGGWRAELGDVFSSLAGPARGARVSWLTATGREPALSVYGPLPGLLARPTIVAYRDQLRVHGQTLFDAEIGSDKSHFLRSRVAGPRFELEASYRRERNPTSARETGVQAMAPLWRGARLGAGFFSVDQSHQHAASTTVMLRIRASRFVELTLERAIASSGGGVNATSSATANVTAGQVRLLHRYQWGVSRFTDQGVRSTVEREQLQSLASYAAGPRFNISLQTAMEWRDVGRMPQWQELQTTVRLARTTRLQLVTAVPHVSDAARLRAQLTQALGSRYALQVDYGRLSSYQAISFASDRPRFKIMLHRVLNVPTPKRGGEVRGRVIDELGRPVSSARVKLGPYMADTGEDGGFEFRNLSRGDYELALDETRLPADYAWDGRGQRLSVLLSSHVHVDLVVAPLNAIHGRVYADRNGNGRFDDGEAVAGAVLHLQDRVTTTDPDGAYSFYNLWPGNYVIRLDAERLPAGIEARGSTDRAVTLEDGRPVTGADFVVTAKTKPIIWRDIK